MRCNEKRRKRLIMWRCACRYVATTGLFSVCPVVFLPAVGSGALVRAHLLLSDWSSLFICEYDSGSCGHPSVFRLFSCCWGACRPHCEVLRGSFPFPQKWNRCSWFLLSTGTRPPSGVFSRRLVSTGRRCSWSLLASLIIKHFLPFLFWILAQTTLRHKPVQKSPSQSYLAGLFDSPAWLILHLNWQNKGHMMMFICVRMLTYFRRSYINLTN